MKIFTFVDFIGDFPHEAVVLIIAQDAKEAVKLLNARLKQDGYEHLACKADLVEVNAKDKGAMILFHGAD